MHIRCWHCACCLGSALYSVSQTLFWAPFSSVHLLQVLYISPQHYEVRSLLSRLRNEETEHREDGILATNRWQQPGSKFCAFTAGLHCPWCMPGGICRKFIVIHLPQGGIDSPCIAPDYADLSVHVNVGSAAQMQAVSVTRWPQA